MSKTYSPTQTRDFLVKQIALQIASSGKATVSDELLRLSLVHPSMSDDEDYLRLQVERLANENGWEFQGVAGGTSFTPKRPTA